MLLTGVVEPMQHTYRSTVLGHPTQHQPGTTPYPPPSLPPAPSEYFISHSQPVLAFFNTHTEGHTPPPCRRCASARQAGLAQLAILCHPPPFTQGGHHLPSITTHTGGPSFAILHHSHRGPRRGRMLLRRIGAPPKVLTPLGASGHDTPIGTSGRD